MKGTNMTRTALVLVTLSFLAGVVATAWLAPSLHAQDRGTKNTELLRTDLGAWCEGKEITVEIQESGPGSSGKHYHPGHAFAWIIEGSLVRMIQGGQSRTSGIGDVIYEGPMQVSETRNSVPVRALIFRVIEKGKPVTVLVP
jgi:quercetin dioxygenase-like cupin family protein